MSDDRHDEGHHVSLIPENDGTLAYRMEEYLMSGTFMMELDTFVRRHAKEFDHPDEGEHLHEWHDAFREYERMLSNRVEAFLRSEGVTTEQAVAACEHARQSGHEEYKYFEYLAASIDYQRFHSVMLEFKAGTRDVSCWWRLFQDR